MVGLAVGFYQGHPVSFTDLSGGVNQQIPNPIRNRVLAILRNQDYVGMQTIDHVSPVAEIIVVISHVCFYRPMSRARKRERGAATYVESWPLRATPAKRSICETRFESGRRIYNACLGEALSRSAAVKADPAWKMARQLPKGKPKTDASNARRAAFVQLNERHNFNLTALQSYGSSLRESWVREHVLAQETQRLARRAFEAVWRYHLGLGGKPRFKPASRPLHTLEAKDHNGSLVPVFNETGLLCGLRWGKNLTLDVIKPKSKKSSDEFERISKAVTAGWLYARVVRTVIQGRVTFRAQFVCDGHPPIRHEIGTERVSLDLGPSVVDVVHDTGSFNAPLAVDVNTVGIDRKSAKLRIEQRRFDRQHRVGSPECFDTSGKHIKGKCHWKHRSKNAERTSANIADIHRKISAHRKSSHGSLWNQIFEIGVDIRTEDLNYVAWQKMFPRSVRDKAPGLFIELGRRKAESAGGSFYEYSPWTTALSQSCVCGGRIKKPLSQRTHHCLVCGLVAPRDRFSAFLGLSVHPVVDPETREIKDLLNVEEAREALLNRHDIGGHPTLSSIKQRGSRRGSHPRHPRAVARRKASLKSGGDRVARGKPTQSVPTAHVATAEALAA